MRSACWEERPVMDARYKENTRPFRDAVVVLSRVPEITAYFWIIKLMSTAMGEATSDYMVYHMNPYLAVGLGAVGFVISLWIQFYVGRYIAWVYWLVVVMVSIFGTMAADATHIVLGVPYYASSIFFAVVLATVLLLWYRVERTLSIHSIFNLRREVFYWATVLATFALGTATGDMTAVTLHLGYLASGILFSLLLIAPGIGYRFFKLNSIFSFWFAYIMTRPVGASFADWFGMPKSYSGLGYGRGIVSIVLTVCIVLLVGYLTVSHKDAGRPTLQTREFPL